jgi:hypothetical protein
LDVWSKARPGWEGDVTAAQHDPAASVARPANGLILTKTLMQLQQNSVFNQAPPQIHYFDAATGQPKESTA